MIKLLNGRGQLGEAISSKLKALSRDEDIFIYHTWNVEDKSEVIQRQELEKFVQFNLYAIYKFTSTLLCVIIIIYKVTLYDEI